MTGQDGRPVLRLPREPRVGIRHRAVSRIRALLPTDVHGRIARIAIRGAAHGGAERLGARRPRDCDRVHHAPHRAQWMVGGRAVHDRPIAEQHRVPLVGSTDRALVARVALQDHNQNDAPERISPTFSAACHAALSGSPAATTRHTVIMTPNAIGIMKKYQQLNTATAAKQVASAHRVQRMSRRVCGGRLPSCHASIALEQEKQGHEKTEPDVEIPVGSAEPQDVEVT